ncbi:MAG: inorganic diphosphatase [Deltaproteobacteria bacterium]|nr:inorganic diphosphatase [Deltaproteobacteria bacterium]
MAKMDVRKRVEVLIDVPRFGFVKHDDRGAVDCVSLLPCPFNYGSIPGTCSQEGDRFDAIVLGPRLARGTRVELPVIAVARFTDAGKEDPKWICGENAMTAFQRLTIVGFFMIYARIKAFMNAIKRRSGATRFDGVRASVADLDRLWNRDSAQDDDATGDT